MYQNAVFGLEKVNKKHEKVPKMGRSAARNTRANGAFRQILGHMRNLGFFKKSSVLEHHVPKRGLRLWYCLDSDRGYSTFSCLERGRIRQNRGSKATVGNFTGRVVAYFMVKVPFLTILSIFDDF